MEIRVLEKRELEDALSLVRETFTQFVAKYYTEEGVSNFLRYFSDVENFEEDVFYGAFDVSGELAGVIGATNGLSHIVAFYVRKKFMKKGVGKALFNRLYEDSENSYVTVNASPYAVGIYEKLGFIEAGETQDDGGKVYTPMMCVFHR